MKKFLKGFLITCLVLLAITSGIIFYIFIVPPSTKLDTKKLVNNEHSIIYYDKDNNQIECGSLANNYVKIENISETTKNAFISIEDKNFYKHNGIEPQRIVMATLKNISKRSFSQGASTITQQLIKNTHLSSEKKISRKINEIKLALRLERQFSKDEILEMYLNTIYFGENCYGIEQASNKYFSKDASELNTLESATLASIIVAPSKLNPIKNIEACTKRRNLVLDKMNEYGYINNENIITLKNNDIKLNINDYYDTDNSFITATKNELANIIEESPYEFSNCRVYTNFDYELQKTLKDNNPNLKTDYQSIVLDNQNSTIEAYYSTCGEIERSPASTAKPWLVYAPSLQENQINRYTKVLDEKTNFDGYSPSNYGDKYYGLVSIENAIYKSLNIPAIKVLNNLGVQTAKNYANKMDIKIDSNNLGIALGAFENGIKLKNLVGAYSTLANYGQYNSPHFIKKIEDFSGKIIYTAKQKNEQVFTKDVSEYVNSILVDTTIQGTAKALSSLPFSVAAKTGTNGNSKGNIDAYCVSYTPNYSVAVWLGNSDNKLMDNKITGSNYPSSCVRSIFETMVNKNSLNFNYDSLEKISVDKINYEENGSILIASENSPEKYKFEGLFLKSNLPKDFSENFEKPKFEDYSINLDGTKLKIEYDSNEITKAIITKIYNNKEENFECNQSVFYDEIKNKGKYEYYITPYSVGKNGIVYGEKIKLPQVDNTCDSNKIILKPNDWWEN